MIHDSPSSDPASAVDRVLKGHQWVRFHHVRQRANNLDTGRR
jgi:hypothetical protein